jgi:hypothetical protein
MSAVHFKMGDEVSRLSYSIEQAQRHLVFASGHLSDTPRHPPAQAKSGMKCNAPFAIPKRCTMSRASDFLAKIFALWAFQTAPFIVLPSGSFHKLRDRSRSNLRSLCQSPISPATASLTVFKRFRRSPYPLLLTGMEEEFFVSFCSGLCWFIETS